MRRYRDRLGNTFTPLEKLDLANLQSDEFDRADIIFLVVTTLQALVMIGVGISVTWMLMDRGMAGAGASWMPMAAWFVTWLGMLLAVMGFATRAYGRHREENLNGASEKSVEAFRQHCCGVDEKVLDKTDEMPGADALEMLDLIVERQGFILPIQICDGKRALVAAKSRVLRRVGVYDN
jgi:hypothetical protein